MTDRSVSITVDAAQELGPMPHTWNYIGYDECNYTYTPEGKELLEKFAAIQEKPYYVRVHHLLCTGNGHAAYKWGSTNAYIEDEQGNPIYNWDLVDLILDETLKPGLKPFIELGFMPMDLADPKQVDPNDEARKTAEYFAAGLSSGPEDYIKVYNQFMEVQRTERYRARGWACPPKDYQKWYDLIYALVRHCFERYGEQEVLTWYWELWNEPDAMYWKGTIDEFNKLYDYTAAAVKAAHPQARIGGPATTGPGRGKTAAHFLGCFLEHCVKEPNAVTGQSGAPLDYVSFHVKGSNFRSGPYQKVADPPSTQWMMKQVELGYQIISRYPGLNQLECVLSEADPDGWAAGGVGDHPIHVFRNTEYYASYVACTFDKIIRFGWEKNWDVRPLTWAFMFVAERCFEGTRAFSTQGIDKAIFNLFRMYAQLGDTRLAMTSSGAQDIHAYSDMWGTEAAPDVSGFATRAEDGSLRVLVFSHHDLLDASGSAEVTLELAGLLDRQSRTLKHYRIDGSHSNAYAEWLRQGKPDYPRLGQYDAIKARDGLELLEPPCEVTPVDGKVTVRTTLPAHSVSLFVLE